MICIDAIVGETAAANDDADDTAATGVIAGADACNSITDGATTWIVGTGAASGDNVDVSI